MKNFLFFLFSFLLYTCAPFNYSYYYCVFVLLIYCMQWLLFSYKFHSMLGIFHFSNLFCLSYLVANFVYPVFVHPYYPSGLVMHDFNEDFISRGVALAQLGSNCFFWGIDIVLTPKKSSYNREIRTLMKENDCIDLLSRLLFFCYAMLILLLGAISYDFYNAFFERFLTLVSFVFLFFTLTTISRTILKKEQIRESFFSFCIVNKWMMLCLFLVVLGLGRIGDRGPIIQYALTVFTIYALLVKRINYKILTLCVIIGVAFMVVVRNSRADGQHQSSMERREIKYGTKLPFFLDACVDLMASTRCMYVGMELTEGGNYLYGQSFIKPVLSPFPFLPTLFSSLLFNSTPSELSTSAILTEATKDRLGREELEGVGTNCIVDIYMNAGLLGVVMIMFLLGRWVGLVEIRKQNSIYYLFCYCIMISYSIYMPRSTIFDFMRPTIWGWLLIYIRNNTPNRFKKNHEISFIHK